MPLIFIIFFIIVAVVLVTGVLVVDNAQRKQGLVA